MLEFFLLKRSVIYDKITRAFRIEIFTLLAAEMTTFSMIQAMIYITGLKYRNICLANLNFWYSFYREFF